MNKEITLLTDEAEGKKFKLTDGVDIAKDNTIYFTDASYKYDFENHLHDILESRPYGRLLSYNPNTKQTKVLLQDLYFANGVTGVVDAFVDNLPGYPDNIHCDGENNYWIAISSSLPTFLEQLRRNRLVRKAMLIMDRYISLSHIQWNGGIVSVDLDGYPKLHVYDPSMSMISSGIKIEDHLYIGSLHYPHIIRFNLSYT
ncbi:Protein STRICTOSIDINE SYNTHASE-LIKE 6 [Bienertia sinuspersici]